MKAPNMDYKLRIPTNDELAQAFGSVRHALNVTNGDTVLQCFLLANPERIPPDKDKEAVIAAYALGPEKEGKRTYPFIAEVARRANLDRRKVKRLLMETGLQTHAMRKHHETS